MAATLSELEALPNWPRLLSREQAAAYLGIAPAALDAGVADGTWPAPIPYGRRLLWDRRRLDEAVDTLSGYAIQSANDDQEHEDWKQRRDAWRAGRKHGR